MIPVIQRTKTDKFVMDLAGVEAGAKMLVPLEDEPFGSLAHTAAGNQNRRSISCAKNRTVEYFIVDMTLRLFFKSQVPALSPEWAPYP